MNNLFLSSRDYKKVTLKPFSYLKPSLNSMLIAFVIVLLPQIIMLAITGSYKSLIIIVCSILGAVVSNFLYAFFKKVSNFSYLSSLVQGIVIGMLLPYSYNPVAVFFITAASIFLSKYIFGGFASCWANPAAVTIAVSYFLNVTVFGDYLVTSADLQTRNAALSLINSGAIPLVSVDANITAFLNSSVFSLFKVSIPDGYVSLFWDTHSIIPAFRFNLITLVSSIVLLSLDMVDFIIPACFLLVYSLLVKFLGPVFVGGIAGQGDVILSLLTSGTLFCTLFILQWFGSTPISKIGKMIYGILAGLFAFLIVGFGTSPVGYVFTVLVMNCLSPVIQVVENKIIRKNIEFITMPQIRKLKEVENV